MNTRKNRKRTWKVQEQTFEEEKEIVVPEVKKPEPQQQQQQQQDSTRLLLFLQSWHEAKEAQVNGTLKKDMPESIADLMLAKGYPISVNVARTKIMNFIRKYNLVKKMSAQGKPNEWTHFNTVKKILEFGPPILPSANVVIPIENIKLEEKGSLKENTLKIAERKVSIDAQKSGSSATNNKKDTELIEIGDDGDKNVLKPRVYFSESEHIDESDDSDMSDEDLDFENPLDKINFGFQAKTGSKTKQAIPVVPPKVLKLDNKQLNKNAMPALNKIDNKVSTRQILPKQQIIPIPQNVNLPQKTNNGAPQQYLIVRPLTPGNANGPPKTLAIPMGGQFKFGGKPETTPTIPQGGQILRTALNAEGVRPGANNNQIKMVSLPKIPAQITMTNRTSSIDSVSAPSNNSNAISAPNSNLNGQTQVNQSPCSSPGSVTSSGAPSVRQLLTNVIQLETNIYNLQKERLQLERERFEMERDYGKEMLNIFREIKDKFCDKTPVPTASAATNVISNPEVEHKKK